MEIKASDFGLSSRVKLEQIDTNHIGIVKRIKSRIIQKDALKIIEISNIIQEKQSGIKVSLLCNPNICSKSVKLLDENGVDVRFE